MRALAVGDNHLGAGSDLGLAPGDRLAEQEQVWRRTLELARDYGCDVVLHGGDLFDKRRPSPDEVLAALRPLTEHAEAGGCPVVMTLGNHERSGVSDATMPAALAALEAMYVSHSPEIVGTFGGVTICALPWAPVSRIVAAQGGGDRDDVNAYAAEILVATARGLRDNVDGPAILLSHFSVSGSSLPTGLPVDQLREPVLELADLEALGFEAIVLGHIHKGQAFGEGTFYVGSPMPLNFGEAGYDHGVWIVELDSAVSGTWVPRFVPIGSRKLATLDVFGPDVVTIGDSYFAYEDLVADSVVKLRIRADAETARKIDVSALKRGLVEAGAHKVYAVELEVERQERARVEGLTDDLDELSALDLWLEATELEAVRAAVLRDRATRYIEAVR